jgi:hypothetical protein
MGLAAPLELSAFQGSVAEAQVHASPTACPLSAGSGCYLINAKPQWDTRSGGEGGHEKFPGLSQEKKKKVERESVGYRRCPADFASAACFLHHAIRNHTQLQSQQWHG